MPDLYISAGGIGKSLGFLFLFCFVLVFLGEGVCINMMSSLS